MESLRGRWFKRRTIRSVCKKCCRKFVIASSTSEPTRSKTGEPFEDRNHAGYSARSFFWPLPTMAEFHVLTMYHANCVQKSSRSWRVSCRQQLLWLGILSSNQARYLSLPSRCQLAGESVAISGMNRGLGFPGRCPPSRFA